MPSLISLRERWAILSPATQLSLLAVLVSGLNGWLGIILATAAGIQGARDNASALHAPRPQWLLFPVLLALASWSQQPSFPMDDLPRHLTAWRVGLDYRAQYPWADTPAINLWWGFDALMGALQSFAGVPALVLAFLIPALLFIASAAVLYAALRRAAPTASPTAFLLIGSVGLALITPRAWLGRPEAALALLAGLAWCCRTPRQAAAWSLGYLVLIPAYWLGWAYAPLALLLQPLKLRWRVALALLLGGLHLGFWQAYSGDYPAIMHWLWGTLSVPATENRPLAVIVAAWPGLAWLLILAATVERSVASSALPIMLTGAWFMLPNQVRYHGVLAFALLPWLLQHASTWADRLFGTKTQEVFGAALSPLLVLAGLFFVGLTLAPITEKPPTFSLPANARVYSEQPYATVFFGAAGIAVDPSYAIGATRPRWRDVVVGGQLNCRLATEGGYTHVLEKTFVSPPACAELYGIQGAWRLWRLRTTNSPLIAPKEVAQ